MADKLEKRTVKVAGFPYLAKTVVDGVERVVHRFAQRWDEIELFDAGDIARGDNNDCFLKPGEKPGAQPSAAAGPAAAISDIGLLTDEQLGDLFKEKPPTVNEILDAVGDDPGLAARALAAEHGSDHEPRKSLVEKLERIEHGSGGDA